jgi:aminoglycoside N3'-acetyltransferase
MAQRAVKPQGAKAAKSWAQVRATRPPCEDRVAEHRARLDAEARARVTVVADGSARFLRFRDCREQSLSLAEQ